MIKKLERKGYLILISILLFIAILMIFKSFNMPSTSRNISTANNNGFSDNRSEASNIKESSKDTEKKSMIVEEAQAEPPVLPQNPAAPSPASASNTVLTSHSSDTGSSVKATKKAVKKTSNISSTQSKTQNTTVSASPKTTAAAYIININGNNYSVSTEERNLFARLVSAEAAGESYEGKLAVATVVINRVGSGIFPDSITQVIMGQEGGAYQFSPVLDGRINDPPTADALKAVDQVLGGYRSFSSKIMWFLNPQKSTSGWIINNKAYFTSIGNHDFYF